MQSNPASSLNPLIGMKYTMVMHAPSPHFPSFLCITMHNHVLPVTYNPKPHGAFTLSVRCVEKLPSSCRAGQPPDPRAVHVLHIRAGPGGGPEAG